GPNCGGYGLADFDGYLATAGNLCAYWQKGPVVTTVILEDRIGRSYDMNVDGLGTGVTNNPLHPIFVVSFFPSNHTYQVEFILENDWASSTALKSARDPTVSYVLTTGSSSPINVYSCGNAVAA